MHGRKRFVWDAKQKKIWLTRIGSSNDILEQKEIVNPDYKDRVFTASFFRDKNIANWMWDEYGFRDFSKSKKDPCLQHGLLLSIKQSWIGSNYEIVKEYCYLPDPNVVKIQSNMPSIYSDNDYLYIVQDYGFVSVAYDQELTQQVGLDMHGGFIIPHSIGITKQSVGLSSRSKLIRQWREECEIRFWALLNPLWGDGQSFPKWIDTIPTTGNPVPFDKIAVNFIEDAFDEFEIVFGPGFSKERKQNIKEELNIICKGSKIVYSDAIQHKEGV